MDNKTGLNPKLADMYEKIMSTPVRSGAPNSFTVPSSVTHQPPQTSSVQYTPPPVAGAPTASQMNMVGSPSVSSTPPVTPPPVASPPVIPQPSFSQTASEELSKPPVSTPNTNAFQNQFTSSLPSRPATNDKQFTYSIKKNTVEVVEPQEHTSDERKGAHKGIPTPVLVIGVILFFAGYLAFWLKVLQFF